MKTFLAVILGIVIGAGVAWFYFSSSNSPGLEDQLRALNLNGATISNELARTGRVIRQKAAEAGQAVSEATADARVTAAIKAKFLSSPDLSAWNISVNTTGGTVTLSGTVSSPENIGHAILLALETDGVREVISTLQVKRD